MTVTMAQYGRKRRKSAPIAAVALVLATAACGLGGGPARVGNGDAGATPSAAGAKAAPPAKKLTQSADTVRGAVDAVIRPSLQLAVRQEKTMDVAAGCKIGSTGAWPRRWGYGRRVVINGNHLTVANNAVRTLRAEGWTVEVNSSTEDILDVDARMGDVLLHLVGEPNPASLLVEGYGPCVQADGTTVPA